jgi:ABC-2 type transport system permease protein
MELLRASSLIFRMHLGSIARSRRTLIAILLAALPPLIAFVVLRFGPEQATAEKIVGGMSVYFSLNFIVPILALVLGAAVVNEEVENRTITYIFTRPVPRLSLLLGRWLATLVLVTALLVGSAAGVLIAAAQTGDPLPDGLVLHYLWASVLGGAVYSLLFAVIGIFMKNPMVLGIGYVFALEGLVANLPGSTGAISIQYYLRSIIADVELSVWKVIEGMGTEFQTPAEATTRLAILSVIAFVVGAWGISRRQYILTA